MIHVGELRRMLAEVPDVEVPAALDGLDASIAYLASDAALASLADDPYWPKWDGPWWHMVLLWELGLDARIPARAVRAMVASLDALPLHTFPLRPEDWPPGLHPSLHASCHCALASIDQVLAACGVDVDAELPWVRPWFARYQLRDGGLNCDETAYLVEGECPSSMVATVPAFEAMLRRGPGEVVDRAAAFLIERALVRGSDTAHNAVEREAARAWPRPTFPRFYYYDVLRGVTALVRWANAFRRELPLGALEAACTHLASIAPDGIVRVGRRAHAGLGTWRRGDDGAWARAPLAPTFPLLDAVGQIGAPSARLTAEWRTTRHALVDLVDAGLVTA
jgi:hypothetical protein